MDSFPHCQVCKKRFSVLGPEPLLLPCLHAVCDTCVTSAAWGTISCTTCRSDVNLGETTLEKDVVRKRQIFQLTAQHCPTEILCSHDDDGNQAQCWCTECEVLLCEHCRQLHDSFKGTRKHRSIKVSDMKPEDFVTEEVCKFHPEQPTCFWDRTCKCLICTLCKSGDHANHAVCGIDVAAATIRDGLKAEEQELGRLLTSQTLRLEKGRGHLQSIDVTSRELANKIHDTFQAVQIGLEQREKEIHVSLQNQSDMTRDKMKMKNRTYSRSCEVSKSSLEYIQTALRCCSEVDILSLSGLKETVHTDITTRSNTEDDDFRPPLTFTCDKLERLRSELSSYGGISTSQGNESFEPRRKEVTTQSDINLAGMKELHNRVTTAEKMAEQAKSNAKGQQRRATQLSEEKENLQKQYSEKCEKIRLFFTSHQQKEGVYLLKPDVLNTSSWIVCTNLTLDRGMVNIKKANINTDGWLCNKPDPAPGATNKERFVKYEGTTTTSPLPLCVSPQYWEVEAEVGLTKALTGRNLLLEVAVCREEERDKHHCVDGRSNSCSLCVARCPTHGDGVCRRVCRDGKNVACLQDTLPNTPGHRCTLTYGVVYDDVRGRVAFIDVRENKVIEVLTGVDFSRPLWSMLGVYFSGWGDVKLRLVVGRDVVMTDMKRALISETLA